MELISSRYLNKNKKHPAALSLSAQEALKKVTQKELDFFTTSFEKDWTLTDIDYLCNRIYNILLSQDDWTEREAIENYLKQLYNLRSQKIVCAFSEKLQSLLSSLMLQNTPYVINNYPSAHERAIRPMHYRDYLRYQNLLEIVPTQLHIGAFEWLLQHLYMESEESYYDTLTKNYRNWYYNQNVSDSFAQDIYERFLKETDYHIYFNLLQKHFTTRRQTKYGTKVFN